MPLQLTRFPSAEPIDLSVAQLQTKQDVGNDDVILAFLVKAARQFAENRTERSLVSTGWKLELDSFPGPSLLGVPYGRGFSLPRHAILLPKNPVIQVASIQYYDMGGVLQTLPTANYVVDNLNEPCRITPVFGQIWPPTLPQVGSVTVNFDAGYAAPFTASATNPGQVTVANWKTLGVNDAVHFSNSGGALPSGMSANMYVASVVSAGVYTLCATLGGAAAAFTDTGSGQNFIGEVPSGILAWLLMRLGAAYVNREEVVILNRGKVEELPYVDELIDVYRVWQV